MKKKQYSLQEIQKMFPIGTIYYPTNTKSEKTIETNNFRYLYGYWHHINKAGQVNDNSYAFCIYDGEEFATIVKLPVLYCEIY